MSTNCRTSGVPNRSYAIAFIAAPSLLVRGGCRSGARQPTGAAGSCALSGQRPLGVPIGRGERGDCFGLEALYGQVDRERELPGRDRERDEGDRARPVEDAEEVRCTPPLDHDSARSDLPVR